MFSLAPTLPHVAPCLSTEFTPASVLVVNPDFQVLAVQSLNDDGSVSWKLPHYEVQYHDEHLKRKEQVALQLSIDAALTVTSQGLFYLGIIRREGMTQNHLYFHKTGNLYPRDFKGTEHHGFVTMRWVKLEAFTEAIRKDDITDPASVSAFAKARFAHVM